MEAIFELFAAIVEALFHALAWLGEFVGRLIFGRMPKTDHLSEAQLERLKHFDDSDVTPSQVRVWCIALAPLIIAMIIVSIISDGRLVILIPTGIVAGLALMPIVSTINYRNERRRILRNLGKLERLPFCPACDYDLGHTDGDACPECGESIAPLQDKNESNQDEQREPPPMK